MTFETLKSTTVAIIASAMTFAATGIAQDHMDDDKAKANVKATGEVQPGQQHATQPGQERPGEEQAQLGDAQLGDQQAQHIALDELQGSKVTTTTGEELGEIREVVLNDERDAISFLLVATDDATIAAPWTAMTVSQEADKVLFSVDKAKTNVKPEANQIQALQKNNLRSLKNLKLQAQNEQAVGDIEKIYVNSRSGDISYGVVTLEGNREARIPWHAFTIEPGQQTANVDVSLRDIHQHAYQKGQAPEMNDMAYQQRLDRTFGEATERRVHGYVGEDGAMDRAGDAIERDVDRAGDAIERGVDAEKPGLGDKLQESAREIGDNVKELYDNAVHGDEAK